MKRAGILLVFASIVGVVVGLFMGCGALFSWNGRHPVVAEPIAPGGGPSTVSFTTHRDTRYTAGIEVVFATQGLAADPHQPGMLLVDAKLPLVARIVDGRGANASEVVGWIEPAVPPTVVYGDRRTVGGAEAVVAERLVGPWPCPRDERASVVVDLGPDRVGSARVVEARVVVYDDKMPSTIKLPLAGAGVGGVAFFAGIALVVIGRFRGRNRK